MIVTPKGSVPPRRSTNAPAPNTTQYSGARHIVLDEQDLPARLVRLLSAYATANHPGRSPRASAAFVATVDPTGLLETVGAAARRAGTPGRDLPRLPLPSVEGLASILNNTAWSGADSRLLLSVYAKSH